MTISLKLSLSVPLSTALLTLSLCISAATLNGKVVGVLDGDTVDVLDASKIVHRIRLAGIDAPEKAQPFGQRSKEHLSDLVFGKQVQVEHSKTDRYGRTIGKIIANGVDANLEQVRAGLAWHYKAYAAEQSTQDRTLYSNAEVLARSAQNGLWRDPHPMAPWDWRHGGKDAPTALNADSGCPCGRDALCTGKKGGQYCLAADGKKRYQ